MRFVQTLNGGIHPTGDIPLRGKKILFKDIPIGAFFTYWRMPNDGCITDILYQRLRSDTLGGCAWRVSNEEPSGSFDSNEIMTLDPFFHPNEE